MWRSLSDRSGALALCALLGVFTSACVQPERPSVGMSKVEASLVFGLEEDVPEPVQTALQQTVTQLVAPQAPAPASLVEEEPLEFQPLAEPKVPLLRAPAAAPRSACPTAPVTAAAEVAPQPRITGDVAVGTSRWRSSGFITNRGADSALRVDLAESAAPPRNVRNVKKISATQYSFEVVEAGDEFITVTTYEVNTAAVNVNPSDGVGTVATPGIGEPERGIVLVKIDRLEPATGQVLNSFAPVVGLLVLPLPVTAGDTFTSTAVDPRTGQTISHESVVKGRERIDACGDLIDGWLVESTRRESGEAGAVGGAGNLAAEITYSQIFATQYGGVPILERAAYAGEDCQTCPFDLVQRVGQLKPDPPAAG